METLARTANRGSVSTGYDIDNSLKLEKNNSERLTRTPSSDGNERTFTFSAWVKFSYINTGVSDWSALFSAGDQASGTPSFRIGHHTNNHLQVSFYTNGAYQGYYRTDALYRDTSAWYHYVIAVDTTQATDTNRVKIYVNGEQASVTSVVSHIAQNYDSGVNRNGVINQIGAFTNSSVFSYASEYVAETHFVDGQALAPTEFGEFDDDSGIWKPKAYTGSYGSNGFYLDYADASDLGDDESGNGNNFTLNNITSADQSTDTPTNNFAIGNAIVYFSNPTMATFNAITEGGTKITKGANGWETLSSTIAVTRGKWYMEMQNIVMPESAMMSVFPADIEFLFQGGQVNNYAGKVSGDGGISYYSYNGNLYQNASNASYGTAWANETNTMAIALDMDNGKVYFARANTWQNSGDPTSGATGTGAIDLIEPSKPHMMGYSIYANNTSGAVNFGGYTLSTISSTASDANGYGTFEYAPPSGYYALCTKNLAEYG